MVRFLTPGEAGRRLGLSRSGVVWLVDTRKLRAHRTASGRRIIPVGAVAKFAEERRARRMQVPGQEAGQ
jgi:excisionase family DNA binding protein